MKTAVVTGGSSGMGKAIASELAGMKYKVIIHGRDAIKTERAVDEIRNRTGNPEVEFIVADISTMRGMKVFAKAVKERTNVIHSLVLSTGVILPDYHLTEDGLEKGFVIQYLSRFAATQMCMPELQKGNAKIVLVGASVLPGAKIYFDDISLKTKFTMARAMAQEMFANHLFVQEFSRRNPDNNIIMNMANVGIVYTDIVRHTHPIFRFMLKIVGRSPESAVRNFTYLAADDAVKFSGYYLKKPGNPNARQKINHDPVVAERLWNTSMELIKPIL